MSRREPENTADGSADELPYRRGVGAALFNAAGQVWIGRRITKPGQSIEHYWQMPQGGIDDDEDPAAAVLRELAEETGCADAEIVAETDGWLTYELPTHLKGIAWRGRYRGQAQKWFALKFLGRDTDFDLGAHAKPEFDAWRWVGFAELPALIVPFKKAIYESIVDEFADIPLKVRSQS
ncbi:MAG: RNA pyrophosphohydrolase [Rhodospirillaceae bacterium]